MMHKLKFYMATVEPAKLYLLNILNLFFKSTHLHVTIPQIRMDLWNVLIASSQIVFGLYFLDLDYPPVSGHTRSTMY